MQGRLWLVVFVLVFVWAGIVSREGMAQERKAEEFYKGATVKFIVPYGAGGSRDVWARTLAPFLEKHTGAKVVVENMAGGSGLKGIDYIYHTAKPDGLTICIAGMAGVVLAKMLELPEAAKSDIDKLSYLARLDITERAVFASKGSGFRSIVDMQKSSDVRFTSTGGTADSAVDSALMSEGFGLKAKIVAGSSGSAEDLIFLAQGKANAKASTFSADYREAVEKGDLNLILFLGKKGNPDFPKVPIALDAPGITPGGKKYIELSTDLVEAGQMVFTSPGLSEDKTLFLERALLASLKEPALLEWAKKDRVNLAYLSGKECKELILRMQGLVPQAERARLKDIVFKKYY
jgi:tripartite-type tricarboxylate transporter receptor subunit TctC